MAREVKFRVYNEYGETKMLYVNELSWVRHESDGVIRAHFTGSTDFGEFGGCSSGFGNADFSEDYGWRLMQYTGIRDKNGKEIYEEDILLVEMQEGDEIHIVKWDKERCGFKLQDEAADLYGFYSSNLKCTIIGNIYENPELINKL